MVHSTRPGWIEVITGVMFAGKSEELIRRVRHAATDLHRVQVFKSHLDTRYGGVHTVSTHHGMSVEATPVESAAHVLRDADPQAKVIAIDEAQFLDAGLVAVAGTLADRGVRVIVAGTDMDFRGDPFGPMPSLLATAEIVDKLHAICAKCGNPACRNQRLVDGAPAEYDSPIIMVGGSESYEARCRHCHEVPAADQSQARLP
jgi:thymidine kinase